MSRFSLISCLFGLIWSSSCARDVPPPSPPPTVETSSLVRVGEVGASAAEARPATIEALRAALREGAERLGADEDAHNRLSRELVLDGSVTAMARTPQGAGVRVRVTVSLSVRDAHGGQILVVLEATTQAIGPAAGNSGEREAFEREVVEGAVDEVIARLEPRLGDL